MIMRSLTMRSVAIAAVVVVAAMATMVTPALAARGEGGPKGQASATLTLSQGSLSETVRGHVIHGVGTGYKAEQPAYLKVCPSPDFASFACIAAAAVAAPDGTLSFDVDAYSAGTKYVAVYQWSHNKMRLMASGSVTLY